MEGWAERAMGSDISTAPPAWTLPFAPAANGSAGAGSSPGGDC